MTIKFKDVSHHNGDYHPDGPTIAKATEGTTFVDDRYTRNRSRTLDGGWPFAGYHFLTTAPAASQAMHAFSVLGKTPAMLDVETNDNGAKPSLSTTLLMIDTYRKLGGIMNLIYLPRWYWSGVWGSPSLKPLLDRGMALISSSYPKAGYTASGPGWTSYGGMHPSIWQYTSTPIDRNAFKGTQAALADLFRLGPTKTPQGGTTLTIDWKDQVVDSGDPSNPQWSVKGTLSWIVAQQRVQTALAKAANVPAIAAAVTSALSGSLTGGDVAAGVSLQQIHDTVADAVAHAIDSVTVDVHAS